MYRACALQAKLEGFAMMIFPQYSDVGTDRYKKYHIQKVEISYGLMEEM